MKFLFMPDFSKITPNVVLKAMGQAFFSMSVGMGILITYASYYAKETNLTRVAATVATFDTLVAILAGIIIFPTVFTFGISPSQGPELIFITLPNLFAQMQLGWLWSSLFFVLVSLAALTSTISLSEVSIAFLQDARGYSRHKATAIMTGIYIVLASLCSLSFGALNGIAFSASPSSTFATFSRRISFYRRADSSFRYSLGGKSTRNLCAASSTTAATRPDGTTSPWLFCLRFIAPISIFLIFLSGIHLL